VNYLYIKFIQIVLDYYRQFGRHDLPWRKNQTPYRVVVSEIMLQQTQAPRVVMYFNEWTRHFPNWKALAGASRKDVLLAWKGLGYNSRAIRLHELAKIISNKYQGRLPMEYQKLCSLPGVGPYTAGAIRAFAWDEWTPIIETNIRRVFIHHFFRSKEEVSDKEIMKVIMKVGIPESPRQWYEALMDYGAHLPKQTKNNPNRQSRHYTKQSAFRGSRRELRGKILKIMLDSASKKVSKQKVMEMVNKNYSLNVERDFLEEVLAGMERDGILLVHPKKIELVS